MGSLTGRTWTASPVYLSITKRLGHVTTQRVGTLLSLVDDVSQAVVLFIEKAGLLAKLEPWRHPDARGKKRADIDNDKFTIKYAHIPKSLDGSTLFILLFFFTGVWESGIPWGPLASQKNLHQYQRKQSSSLASMIAFWVTTLTQHTKR